jgi:DNA-binding NarL/FixJ family response regulator
MKTSVYIVDDHPVVRRGFTVLIEGEMGLTVCGAAGSAMEAIAGIRELRPDIVLTDLSMPGSSGLQLVEWIVAELPAVKVLVCSTYDDALYAERVIAAGAHGYVRKQEAETQIIEAIKRVRDGRIYLETGVRDELLRNLFTRRRSEGVESVTRLSNRELDVFSGIGQGLTSKEIAQGLNLSTKTVETYRANIKTKLGIERNGDLVRRAVLWVDSSV